MRRTVLLLALVSFACAGTPPKEVLQITGAKGGKGLSVTNRERTPLTQCTVTVLERGRDDEWSTTVPYIETMDTWRIDWTTFKAKTGQPMPAYIGVAAKYVTISCLNPSGKRLGGGLSF
jgi:hypothetical protein